MHFKGSMVALVTPMHEDGSIDEKSLHDLLEWHIANKTEAIIAAGTTGESATLSPEEQRHLINLVVKQVKGRIPVIAGAGSPSTKTACALAKQAKEAKADACLIVTPYYNKPTQEGLYQHYKFIAEQTQFPIILYNVPGRTACDLLPETIARLATLHHIIGVKEATGKMDRTKKILELCGNQFDIYSGDDATAMDCILSGAKGVISVTANVVPLKMQQLCEAALQNDTQKAKALNEQLMLLHQRLFIESNPIPVKWALHHMKKIGLNLRLPLLPLDKRYHEEVKEALHHAGVE